MSSPPHNTESDDHENQSSAVATVTEQKATQEEAPAEGVSDSHKESVQTQETIMIASEIATKRPRIKVCITLKDYSAEHKEHSVATGTRIVYTNNARPWTCLTIDCYFHRSTKKDSTSKEPLKPKEDDFAILKRQGYFNIAINYDDFCVGYKESHLIPNSETTAYLTDKTNSIFCLSCAELIKESGRWDQGSILSILAKRNSLIQSEESIRMLKSTASKLLAVFEESRGPM